jgi:hypothetical protein
LRSQLAGGIAASRHLRLPASRRVKWRLAVMPKRRRGTILGMT